jgi:hypothetical protein
MAFKLLIFVCFLSWLIFTIVNFFLFDTQFLTKDKNDSITIGSSIVRSFILSIVATGLVGGGMMIPFLSESSSG